ncbi:glycosyltransferase family 9 protein [Leeuwenhoekiella sp. H156]|uniref:glycosyltransferase family 9 protein n=1 Tax=Leeuwenhoekiella sp. H156 TaxID=3450128 RepID=UPI003FA4B71B
MKILVIQQKMIGDVLTSSILFEAIRKVHPDAELHYLIKPHTFAVVQNNPNIDQIIFDQTDANGDSISFLKFATRIRNENYDWVFDVYSKLGSALLSLLSGAPRRVGLKKSYTKIAYNCLIKPSSTNSHSIPMAYYNRLEFLEPMGINPDFSLKPKINLSPKEKTVIQSQLLKEGIDLSQGRYIMVNCLGSGPAKTYPLSYMASLLDKIVSENANLKLFLNYIPSQEEEVKKLKSYCRPETLEQVMDFYAKDLRSFITLTSFCEAVMGNEGGAINIGKALNLKTYAIFSPSIKTSSWAHQSSKRDGYTHLSRYAPELFEGKKTKEIKENTRTLYLEFKPELFEDELLQFLN